MITAARSWLASIVLASVLLSAVRTLTPEGPIRRIGAFTGGLILLALLLAPLRGWETDWPEWDFQEYENAIARRRDELEQERETELRKFAAEQVERLIEEEAAKRGESLRAAVEIRMEEGVPFPWSAELSGTWDADLAAWIETEAGIPSVRQSWKDSPIVSGSG